MKHIATVLLLLLLYPATITQDSPIKPPTVAHKPVTAQRKAEVSRGAERQYIGEFEVTAYCLNKQPTKLGIWPRAGVVAVDPAIIPLGTRIFVEGYGSAICADIGPEIQGRELDLWMDGYKTCVIFGRKKLKVWRE